MTGSEKLGPSPLATILALWLFMPKQPKLYTFQMGEKKNLSKMVWSEVLTFSYKLIILQFYMEYFPTSLDSKG